MNPDLHLALQLADRADEITLRHFRSAKLGVKSKSDATPVSDADLETERVLREALMRERSSDGVLGEEFGSEGNGARRWIVDPIDGTGNYVRGVPVYATLIALEVDGRVEVGVVSAPALAHRWWASRGDGAFRNGTRIGVSEVARLDDAFVSYDDDAGFAKAGSSDAIETLKSRCARSRAFGDFWSYMLVAEGAIDIAVEPRVAVWDMAAIQPIVEEAGGRFTSLRGEARPDGGSGLATNGLIHDEVLAIFASKERL